MQIDDNMDLEADLGQVSDLNQHPLANVDFLESASDMLELRAQRRAEMEKIEADPEAYLASAKVNHAREKVAKLMARLKNRSEEPEAPEDLQEDIQEDQPDRPQEDQPQQPQQNQLPKIQTSIVDDVSDDGQVDDEAVILGPGGAPNAESFDFQTSSGITLHFHNVRKVIINMS